MTTKLKRQAKSVKISACIAITILTPLCYTGCKALSTTSNNLSAVSAPYQNFTRLPIGSIKPQGWLWNVAEMQSTNFSKELPKHDVIFRNEG